MADQPPLCVRCGYPARGLETPECPECGCDRQPATLSKPIETAKLVVSPRTGVLGLIWREQDSLGRLYINLAAASTLAAMAIVWTWLIDPIRASLLEPISAVTTLFQLVFVIAIVLCAVATLLVMFEHAAVFLLARLLHVAKARLIALRVSSISTVGLVVGGAATLAIVAAVRLLGVEGILADTLPAGGAVAGLVTWMRSMSAGLWAACLLRDAGW
ncbi:MAG: hypothetical protein AAFR76_14490 [Planctomycetota bacterium]